MTKWLSIFRHFLKSSFRTRRDLAFESLLLRQQLAVMTHACSRPPSQTWRSFLENHARDIIAVDFFTEPTAIFRVLFVLVVLSHDRRKILHTNATEHPTAVWTARQLLEAIGTDDVPTYLLHDRDAIFGAVFKRQAASAGLREIITAPRSPWQNPYAERVIGSKDRCGGLHHEYQRAAA